ncbi:MAG: ABC transporter permease [Candidatus Tectomicrobia bacterium]|nr:ABC transporter permease [Candidatus Tectomicrobia bacterium]
MVAGAGRSGHLISAWRAPARALFLGRYSPILYLVLAWEIVTASGVIPETVLPRFSEVMAAWGRLILSGDLHVHAASSVWREVAGFSLSVLFGTTVGIAMARFRLLRDLFEPLLRLLFPLPKSALIPILIVWLGIGHASKVAVIFLGCILPVIVSSFNGARGVDHHLVWSALTMGTGRRKLLWKVIIPAALPDILSGTRLALAVSFVLLVSSEMLAGNTGLGFLTYFLGEGGDFAGMFAAIFTLTLLGFVADRLYLRLMRRILIWQREGQE